MWPSPVRVGTAVGLMVRKPERLPQPIVRYRQFWGTAKRADLIASLDVPDINEHYETVTPVRSNRFSFRSSDVEAQYLAWPRVVDLCAEAPISGLQEMRRGALMDVDPERLAERMRLYYDPTVEWPTLQDLKTGLTQDGGRFDAKACRTKALASERFDQERIKRYALYPFDLRWCYHSNVRPLWNEPRPALAAQSWEGNAYFVARMLAERPNERIPVTVTNALPDYHLLRPNVVAIPMRLRHDLMPENSGKAGQMTLPADDVPPIANLSTLARSYLASLGVTNLDADADTAGLIWMHALAIGNAPAYLAENADGIRQDFPRVPLPLDSDAFLASTHLGDRIVALLDTDHSVLGISAGTPRLELKAIGAVKRVGGGSIDLMHDATVTVGWGHPGKNNIVMPGKGRIIERPYTDEERGNIGAGAEDLGLTADNVFDLLGWTTYDIYLNEVAFWSNVPVRVWEYTIGGYQVIKKWLSYRERDLLGRPLERDEVRDVTHMARRIAALLLLEPALDANYQRSKQAAHVVGA